MTSANNFSGEPDGMEENPRTRRPWIWALAVVGVSLVAFLAWDLLTYGKYLDAFSGATPRALRHDPPDGLVLTVGGRVESPWRVTTRSLRLLAPVRIRTREVTQAGKMMGAYVHTGVPVMHILAGVDPKPPPGEPDDRPLDMMVLFENRQGKSALFTYGELVIADDTLPVTLAWKREPLLPERGAETYAGNRLKNELSGLRLICPREVNTARYLDDVVKMTLMDASLPQDKLPVVRKHFNCSSARIRCLHGENKSDASLEGYPREVRRGWFRIGHGLGIHENRLADARGVSLKQFLKKQFPGCGAGDFFLVCGCDGYRVMLSGREIFADPMGECFLLMEEVNGSPPVNGIMLGAFGDFFIDRCVRGVSHLVWLDGREMQKELTKKSN